MKHEIPQLDRAGLRDFAFKMAAVIGPLFGLVLPWLFNFNYPVTPWIIAAVLVLWGLVAPGTLGPLYRGWMVVGIAIGWFNSHIILGLVFYVILFPMGLIMRLFGGDPMARKFDPSMPSYRTISRTKSSDHMEKPY